MRRCAQASSRPVKCGAGGGATQSSFALTLLPARWQSELGDVVYVELPQVGATVTAGSTFGVVESVKVR